MSGSLAVRRTSTATSASLSLGADEGLAAPPRLDKPGDFGGHGATDSLRASAALTVPPRPVEGPQTEVRRAARQRSARRARARRPAPSRGYGHVEEGVLRAEKRVLTARISSGSERQFSASV